MNLTERKALELKYITLKEQKRKLAKYSFIDYLEYVNEGRYKRSKFHLHLAETLEKVERGEIKRLIIEVPPRHGKSETVTKAFPAWWLGKRPYDRVMGLAYGESLAEDFGKSNRKKITDYGEDIFEVGLAKGSTNKVDWLMENEIGGMISAGFDGTITGKGADLMIIDDPIKNFKEAQSKRKRDDIWETWTGDLYTRIQKGGACIVIMTRRHKDDIIGRLLNPAYGEPDDWTVIRFPAICEEEGDELGRSVGEGLWSEHYDLAWYEKTKKIVGNKNWTSQYQQNPTSAEGEIIKREWIRYYDELPCKMDEFDLTFQSWDLAVKDKKTSDYCAGHFWGLKGADIFLLDRIKARLNYPAQRKAIHNFKNQYPMCNGILIEDKANGPAVISELKGKVVGIIEQPAFGDKESRMKMASIYFEAGNVYIPSAKIKKWSPDFVDEICDFPNAEHDDDCDAMVYPVIRLARSVTDITVNAKPIGTYTKTELEDLGYSSGKDNPYKTSMSKSFKRHGRRGK